MKIAGVIPLVFISLTSYSLPLLAQLAAPVSNRTERSRIRAQQPKFPDHGTPTGRRRGGTSRDVEKPIPAQQPKFPDNGAPTGRRRGGTSRDGCPVLNTPLTALVPGEETLASGGRTETKFISKSFLTSTVTSYPTFWFYIPQLPSTVALGEFVLQNEAGDNIYRTSLTLPQEPGAIGIGLPSSQQYSLQIDKKYHWYFKVYCGAPQKTPEYFFVDGWVQRVTLTPQLTRQLKMARRAKYMAYAANNIWLDALTDLANLRQKDPHNAMLAKDWADILSSANLQDLTHIRIDQRYSQLPNRM